MCFPPFCDPAVRFLGCFSLRTGAICVLVLNAAYGLLMVVTHSLLLGDSDQTTTTTTAGPGQRPMGGQDMGGEDPDKVAGTDHHWFLQLLDLDIGFSHRLLGFDDYSCLITGLLYGILIIALCVLMFNAMYLGGPTFPVRARMFVAFINLEIVVYVGLVLCKLPKLCKIQEEYLPLMSMDCDVLRFLYLERVVVFLTIAGLSCWVFASLAYILTVGHQAIDRPEYAHALEQQEMQGVGLMDQRQTPVPGLQSGYPGQPRTYAGSRPPVGSAVSVAGRYPAQSRTSMAPHPPTSYSIPGHHNMPRASSSMVTTTTSHSHAERQGLINPGIKGPLAVY